MKFVKLKLFSPIMVKGEAPYENPWDGGDDYRVLIEREKKKCMSEIYVNACGALSPVVLPPCFERRIYSAVPVVEEKNGRLMLCLNCECYRTLSESELDELCTWWEKRVIQANESLSKMQIKTRKLGRIIIYLWFMNGWAIEPIFPAMQRS
ncbi:hypothetical protein [Ruminococcus flavefaciens]|uniref:hypothetical protein n=1 Tax=Ruminococcus flavefaciens TaxID=1265 RepID=UPI0026F0934E|nr:hypothetical protein [Ruminococcus flavefaciens]